MAVREKERYGNEWSQPWAHESAYNSILLEMPRILKKTLVTVDAFLYPTRMDYLNALCRHGEIYLFFCLFDSNDCDTGRNLIGHH